MKRPSPPPIMSWPPMTDGPAIDRADPTSNVRELVEAGVRRLDDLRDAQSVLREAEMRHVGEMASLRAAYDEKLRRAEADRIDAIRAVDVGNVQRAAEVAATGALALQAQVGTLAEALRVSLVQTVAPLQEAIADLRRTQYEQAGSKAQVGEARLSQGALIAVASLVFFVLFSVAGVAVAIIVAKP